MSSWLRAWWIRTFNRLVALYSVNAVIYALVILDVILNIILNFILNIILRVWWMGVS